MRAHFVRGSVHDKAHTSVIFVCIQAHQQECPIAAMVVSGANV